MTLDEILEYVEEHASDVADLAKVSDIRRIESRSDPWRKQLIKELRARYEGEAETAERRAEAISLFGALGGSSTSKRKAQASRANGKKGGRPHKPADR
jgi:hypothetical protein